MGDTFVEMPPQYSLTCNCGVKITGHSEGGLAGLIRRHLKDGLVHKNWIKTYDITKEIDISKLVANDVG